MMTAGNINLTTQVAVDSGTGVVTFTGTGLAQEIAVADYNSRVTLGQIPVIPTLNSTAFPYSVSHPVKSSDITIAVNAITALAKEMARQANVLSSAIVTHIQTNAVAHVTSQILGKTPSPNNANTNIQAPSSPVDIPIQ